MANVKLLLPKIFKWEGLFVNDPTDRGGATNMGITISTWKACGYDKDGDGDIDVEDLRLLNKADVEVVLKRMYWDRWQADNLINQSVANILVDWVWGSGAWGIKIPQRLLGLKDDGIVGPQTLRAVNLSNQGDFFNKVFAARVKFLHDIVNASVKKYEDDLGRKATEQELLKHTQKRFLQGWLNRLVDFKFEPTA